MALSVCCNFNTIIQHNSDSTILLFQLTAIYYSGLLFLIILTFFLGKTELLLALFISIFLDYECGLLFDNSFKDLLKLDIKPVSDKRDSRYNIPYWREGGATTKSFTSERYFVFFSYFSVILLILNRTFRMMVTT